MVRVRKKILKYQKPNRGKRRYYSFLTIALFICVLILLRSVLSNILKIVSYSGKIRELEKIQAETIAKNTTLKKKLEDLDSKSYEAIARNNLKMSGEDEVLIIIHEPEQLSGKEKQKVFDWFKKGKNDRKKDS